MKALVKRDAKRGLSLEDLPRPSPGEGELLLKVRKAAICGTDLHIYEWNEWAAGDTRLPVVLGHEFVGEIAEVGRGVSQWEVGQRVCAEGHIFCGQCRNCRTDKARLCMATYEAIGRHRDGGLAEYVVVPAKNTIDIPSSISDETAALLDPFGNAVFTSMSFDLFAKEVLITGAGPIGCMAAAVCKAAGAHKIVVTDVEPSRLKIAEQMGATHTVDVTERSITDVAEEVGIQGGFHVGLEMSGSAPALSELVANIAPGGKVALLGILPPDAAIDWHTVIFKGITLKGIYGREIFRTWFQAIGILETGLDLSPVISHTFSLDQFEEAFELALAGKASKVVFSIAQ